MFSVADLAFRVYGDLIPSDHSYHLFSSLCRIAPALHQGKFTFGLTRINGRLAGNKMIQLTPRSRFVLRLPTDHISDVAPIAGTTLRLGDSEVTVGVGKILPLKPLSTLWSRMVVIRGFDEPEEFLLAARRQLEALDIQALPSLIPMQNRKPYERKDKAKSPWVRRTVKIKNHTVAGYAMQVVGLSPEESIRLQAYGIGGRRHFGCGVFTPLPAARR